MPFSVNIDGDAVKDLENDIAVAGKTIEERIAGVFQSTAPAFMKVIDHLVPKDTEALRQSMDYQIFEAQSVMRFGALKTVINPKSGKAAHTYIGYVHEGTSSMPARPYMTDAIKKMTKPGGRFMREMAAAGATPIDLTVTVKRVAGRRGHK